MFGKGKDPKPDISKNPKIVRKKSKSRSAVVVKSDKASVEQVKANVNKPGLLSFTFTLLYKNLYILGVTLMRRRLRYQRRFRRGSQGVRGQTLSFFGRIGQGLRRLWKGFVRRIKLPFVRIRNVRTQMQPVIERSRKDGKVPVGAYGRIAATFLRLLYDILRTLINYGAPIAAAIFLYRYIGFELDKPMVLEVEYNGERLGYIQYEAEFESAKRILSERFISDDEQMVIGTPTFYLVEEARTDLDPVSPKELANEIVRTSNADIEWGYGLYIDNTFYGAVTEAAPVLDELEAILESNAGGGGQAEGVILEEQVQFVKSIKLEDGLYPLTSMVAQKDLYDVIYLQETVDEYYTVEQGDSPSLVSEKLGLPIEELESLNPGLDERMIPGAELRTQIAQPFLSVMNIYTVVYDEEFDFEVEDIESDVYAIGVRQVEQEGENGVQQITAEISKINGIEVNRNILDTEVIREAVPEKAIVGTNDPRQQVQQPSTSGSGSGSTGSGSGSTPSSGATASPPATATPPPVSTAGFGWPTDGGVITVGLGGYYGHTGVDIPRPAGTNVYASRAGTVVLARNTYTGYGRYIMIDHGDGFVTLYAHNSELYVNVGDYVSQGQVIAAVGRTGNATGNHVHFEVRYNGQIQNPAHYIGR